MEPLFLSDSQLQTETLVISIGQRCKIMYEGTGLIVLLSSCQIQDKVNVARILTMIALK